MSLTIENEGLRSRIDDLERQLSQVPQGAPALTTFTPIAETTSKYPTSVPPSYTPQSAALSPPPNDTCPIGTRPVVAIRCSGLQYPQLSQKVVALASQFFPGQAGGKRQESGAVTHYWSCDDTELAAKFTRDVLALNMPEVTAMEGSSMESSTRGKKKRKTKYTIGDPPLAAEVCASVVVSQVCLERGIPYGPGVSHALGLLAVAKPRSALLADGVLLSTDMNLEGSLGEMDMSTSKLPSQIEILQFDFEAKSALDTATPLPIVCSVVRHPGEGSVVTEVQVREQVLPANGVEIWDPIPLISPSAQVQMKFHKEVSTLRQAGQQSKLVEEAGAENEHISAAERRRWRPSSAGSTLEATSKADTPTFVDEQPVDLPSGFDVVESTPPPSSLHSFKKSTEEMSIQCQLIGRSLADEDDGSDAEDHAEEHVHSDEGSTNAGGAVSESESTQSGTPRKSLTHAKEVFKTKFKRPASRTSKISRNMWVQTKPVGVEHKHTQTTEEVNNSTAHIRSITPQVMSSEHIPQCDVSQRDQLRRGFSAHRRQVHAKGALSLSEMEEEPVLLVGNPELEMESPPRPCSALPNRNWRPPRSGSAALKRGDRPSSSAGVAQKLATRQSESNDLSSGSIDGVVLPDGLADKSKIMMLGPGGATPSGSQALQDAMQFQRYPQPASSFMTGVHPTLSSPTRQTLGNRPATATTTREFNTKPVSQSSPSVDRLVIDDARGQPTNVKLDEDAMARALFEYDPDLTLQNEKRPKHAQVLTITEGNHDAPATVDVRMATTETFIGTGKGSAVRGIKERVHKAVSVAQFLNTYGESLFKAMPTHSSPNTTPFLRRPSTAGNKSTENKQSKPPVGIAVPNRQASTPTPDTNSGTKSSAAAGGSRRSTSAMGSQVRINIPGTK